MNKIFTILSFFAFTITFSQSYDDIMNYSSFYNKGFKSFKDYIKKDPIVDTEKFGIQKVIYRINDYSLAMEESEKDNGLISSIFLYSKTKDSDKSSNDWYNIIKKIELNELFVPVEVLFEDNNKDFKSKEMKTQEMIILLRSLKELEKVNYGVTYKKDGLFYSFFVVDGSFVFSLKDKL
ncbi:hypothetical protein HZP35_15285 [Elizabethkingia anophelis]|nr:hypothetical protein [Elizabethkingia anophelis]MCT4156301.1 hypothetical protein [Elizabethkingia anophelis]MCT4170625.1 hypothetical protein [Elizabethkingia anophelis]MCT4245041.1 hypothetical protein [Elizabethkingia anophelis]MCT4248838.1 hypothetical protein [Elizabethkingia anophelis]